MALIGYDVICPIHEIGIGQEIKYKHVRQTLEALLRDATRLGWVKTDANLMYYGKYDKNKLGGFIKRLPGWSEYIDNEAKGNLYKSYFVSTLNHLSHIAWDLWGKHTPKKPEWTFWEGEAEEIWKNKDTEVILSDLRKVITEIPTLATIQPVTPPPQPPAEFKIFGLNLGQILLGAGLILGGIFIYNQFIRRR